MAVAKEWREWEEGRKRGTEGADHNIVFLQANFLPKVNKEEKEFKSNNLLLETFQQH